MPLASEVKRLIQEQIILRARQNYLFQEYAAQHPQLSTPLLQDAEAAWTAYLQKNLPGELCAQSAEQWPELLSKLEADNSALHETLKSKHEKYTMHLTALKVARKALDEASKQLSSPSSSSSLPTTSPEFLKAVEPVLALWLDKQKGSSVTDPPIYRTLPAQFEQSFMDDMAKLGVEPPTTLTRVTEYVPEIVTFVQKIIENGYAYATEDGSVYFNVNAFDGAKTQKNKEAEWQHTYAKLQPWSKGDSKLLEEGEGSLSTSNGKRSNADFALWKASKPGEPAWDSPWGKGRPGWHIECSVMASEVIGTKMDIHSGGSDLAFPHHDNEIAQSEVSFRILTRPG